MSRATGDNDDDNAPPPPWRDCYLHASVLNLISSAGYLVADLNRGFYDVDVQAANVLFIVLGFTGFLQAVCFYATWRQLIDESDAACVPFGVRWRC